MALNVEQKNILDNAILNYIMTHPTWIFFHDLKAVGEDVLNVTLNIPTISASLNRIMKDTSFDYDRTCFEEGVAYNFRRYEYRNLIKIVKNKNILTFVFDNNKNLNYDFQTGKYLEEIIPNKDTVKIFDRFATIAELLPYEWLFNYMTDIEELYELSFNNHKVIYEKMPKGLANFLKENEIDKLTVKILREYYYTQTFTPSELRFIKQFSLSLLVKVNETMGDLNNLNKMLIASTKNYEINNLRNATRRLIDLLYSIDCKDEIVLDTNRGIGHNLEMVENYIHKHNNEILEKNLQRLNFINGLIFDDYIVVVPQTIKDKAEEGKMQNNCVGYHYDVSIREGKNLIYFLRNVNTPKKSLVTCRYNVKCKGTVEARRVNNTNCKTEDFSVIEKIDEIIRENLK